MNGDPGGNYAPVNGLEMYYEILARDDRWSCCTAPT